MAQYNGNNPYLKFDAVDVAAYFVSVSTDFGGSSVDITAGAGRSHVQRAGGLRDYSMSVTLTYDADSVNTYITKLQPQQIVEVEYGPEGNTTGKPRHLQKFVVDSVSVPQSVKKDHVTFEIKLSGADEPTADMTAGDVFA